MIENSFEILGKSPKSYKEFLLRKGSAIIDGYKILGLPTNRVKTSVFEGTLYLRKKREDLSKNLIPISFNRNLSRALCLDLENGNEEDAPLVEIDLQNNTPPKALGKTFKEWVEEHKAVAKRFSIAWNRIKNRQKEAKSRAITQWKSIIIRVKDYVIGVAAFRYNSQEGCLEVDEFFPIDQPHIKKGEAIRVLLTEMFSRARNYSGSLNIIFTKDLREDKDGRISKEFQNLPEWKYRKPTVVPQQIVELGKRYGIIFKERKQGRILHEEGVNLWFKMLELPHEIEKKIEEIEKAGYLRRELIAQVISTGIWSKEEAIWFFLNAPKPESILLGSDLPEKRLYYADSFNYARSALLATRFKQSIMSELTEKITGASLSAEEIEKTKVKCYLEPKRIFWILKCNCDFNIPSAWMVSKERVKIKKGESVVLLSRPKYSGDPEQDKAWIREQVEMLLNSEIDAKYRILLLSNEMINPLILNIIYKNREPEKIRKDLIDIVNESKEKGVYILFAPTRMYLLLDEEIEKRMQTVRRFCHLPSRKSFLKLKIVAVPKHIWENYGAISNASKDAKTFASLLSNKIDVNRYRKSFSFNCETVERFALQEFPVIAELEKDESDEILKALTKKEDDCKGIMFSYVRPEDMPLFLKRIKNKKLRMLCREIDGGIVVTISPWESFATPITEVKDEVSPPKFDDNIHKLTDMIISKSKTKKYYGNRKEIDRAHERIKEAINKKIPLSMTGIRSHIFIQVIREYIYYSEIKRKRRKFLSFKRKTKSPMLVTPLKITYGDGTKGENFPLFSLIKTNRPKGNFLKLHVALVSSRHMEVDHLVDFSLIRNAPLQWKETSADQEEYAFKQTYKKIDSLLKFLKGEINEEDLDLSLRACLKTREEIKDRKKWQGFEVHLYHATGLEPAVVGAYHAIIDLLRKHRRRLIIVPRIIMSKSDFHKGGDYEEGEEWY